MSFGCFSTALAQQRFFSGQGEDLRHRNFMLIPFENQCAIWAENSKAFQESRSKHSLPVPLKFAVFLGLPSFLASPHKVGRVEYDHSKGGVRKRQSGEICHNIRLHLQCARSASATGIRQDMALAAFVHKNSPVVCAIKPKHTGAAAGV